MIRWGLVVLYIWAAIQKLNVDYFNPEVSCAVSMNAEIAAYFPFLPFSGWILHATIWGTFFFDFAIALCLLVPRTRTLGFVLAIFFHLWLGLHRAFGVYSFSALVFGILVLFLPCAALPHLRETWRRQLLRLGGGDIATGRVRALRSAVVSICVVMVAQLCCYLVMGRSLETFWTANRIGFVLFAIWGTWISICYLIALRRSRGNASTLCYHGRPTWAWLGLALVIFNGVWPWIGLKTQTAFSMYSNLRSEREGNHFFLRRVDLFDYQTDMVELVSSEPDLLAIGPRPRGIQQFANPGRIFPYFELRRLVSETEGDVRLAERHDNIEAIYKKLTERRDTADVTSLLKELHRIVNEAIRTQEPGDDQAEGLTFDLSEIDMKKLRDEFAKKVRHKATALKDIREIVEQKLAEMLARNPLRMDYQEKYEQIVAEYNREKDRATIEKTFEELTKLVDELDKEQRRAVAEGLEEDELGRVDTIAGCRL